MLRANTGALADAADEHLWESGGHLVLFRAGNSLGEAALLTEAKEYFYRLHIAAAQQLGLDHPDTLAIRTNLAHWRDFASGSHPRDQLS